MLGRSCFGPPSGIERSDLAKSIEQMPCSEQWTVLASSVVNWLEVAHTRTHTCKVREAIYAGRHAKAGFAWHIIAFYSAQATVIFIRASVIACGAKAYRLYCRYTVTVRVGARGYKQT
jgi:hypothetical protein